MNLTGPTAVDLVDDAPAAVMVTDVAGRIIDANKLLRSWAETVDGPARSLQEMLSVSSCLHYESALAPTLVLSGELSDVVLELQVDGSSVRSTLWAARRVGDDEVHWVGLDITTRREREREFVAPQRRLARLQRLSAALVAPRTPEEIGDALLRHLVDGIKADYGTVKLVNRTGTVDTVATASIADTVRVDPIPSELVHAVIEDRRPTFVTGGLDEATAPITARSQLAVLPLVGESVLGVVSLHLSRTAPHEEDERQLLLAAVEMATSSLDRTILLRRLEEIARLNADLSRLLYAMEDKTSVSERAQSMAEHLVPDHADMAAVDLVELAPALAGLRHIDPSKEPAIHWLHRRLGARATARTQPVARERRPAWDHGALTATELSGADLDPAELEVLATLEVERYVRIPLSARGRTIGTLTLASSQRGQAPDDTNDEFYGRLADACALSLDNARLYEHERGIARQLQSALLPERLPDDPRFSIHTFYEPARNELLVGGDWYDAFMLDADRLAVVVGDVVGGGVAAARTMGKLRTVTHAFSQDGRGVAGTLAGLHRFATRVQDALASSIVYLEIDLAAATVDYGSAGHLPAVLVAPGSDPIALWAGRGPLLGVAGSVDPNVARITLAPGSSIVVYTDGLIERPERSIDRGISELVTALSEDPTLVDRPHDLARRLGSQLRDDDTCVLTVRFTGSDDAEGARSRQDEPSSLRVASLEAASSVIPL